MVEFFIKKWKKILDISDWQITTEQIYSDMIDYDDQDYFIGIERDFANKVGVIHHDIPLKEIDIVHELLHVKYPEELFPNMDYYDYEDWIDKTSYKFLEKYN